MKNIRVIPKLDIKGPNLIKVVENLNIQDNVFFSAQRLEFEKM